MSRDDTSSLLRTSSFSHIIISWGLTSHHVSYVIKLFQGIEKFILWLSPVLEVISFSWTACKINECLMSKAKSKVVVISMNLCISFLKQEYPELVSITSWKHWSTIVKARNVIINSNDLPFSVLTESYLINTHLIVLFGDKESLNKFRSLSETGGCW